MVFGRNLRIKPLTIDETLDIIRPALSRLYEGAVAAQSMQKSAIAQYRYATLSTSDGNEDDRSDVQLMNDHSRAMKNIEQVLPFIITASFAVLAAGDAVLAEAEELAHRTKPQVDPAKSQPSVSYHSKRDASGPAIGTTTFGAYSRAVINNWRHYPEWNKEKVDKRTQCNINILSAAGLAKPWNVPLSDRAFELLKLESYNDYEKMLRLTLEDMYADASSTS